MCYDCLYGLHTICKDPKCVCAHKGNTRRCPVARNSNLQDAKLIAAVREWQNLRWGVPTAVQAS